MPAGNSFNLQFGAADAPAAQGREDGPMRLLLIGDFSGREARGQLDVAGLPDRKPVKVDVDNLDAVLRRMAPAVPQAGGGEARFAELGDFHPDALFRRLPVFAALRSLRERLRDPVRFADAAAELMASTLATAPAPLNEAPAPLNEAPAAASAPAPAPADPASLLGSLLGMPAASVASASAPAAAAPAPADAIQALIRHIVAPHIVHDAMPQQAQYLASVDAATSEQMRAVLHAPAFQALEAAWRGVQFLVSRLELNEDLELWLFDASRAELLADVAAVGNALPRAGVWRALVERVVQAPGGGPWHLLAGLYGFDATAEDAGLLAALGVMASQAGGPFVASGSARIAGCAGFATQPDSADWQPLPPEAAVPWQALRQSAVAPWLGLVAPRFLLRLPYGRATDEIDAFSFEEFAGSPPTDAGLWGHGALAVALLTGLGFTNSGWQLRLGEQQDVSDLPAWVLTHDGSKQLHPVAEAYLSERAGKALLDAGLMPLIGHRHASVARLMRFQSIALPAQGLAALGAGG